MGSQQDTASQDSDYYTMLSIMFLTLVMMVTTNPLVKREASSQSQCNNHPCGWIKYHNSNWNSYSAYDVIENTFCPCPALSRCRYSDTNTALDLHRFTCQGEDSNNRIFPSMGNSRRRRRDTESARRRMSWENLLR